MQCSSCGFDNPEGMQFCGECAAPLKLRCPACGFENPPGFKFCGECATPLTRRPQVTSPKPQVSDAPPPPITYTPSYLAERIRATVVTDGERKTITALFADLKGSTALIEGLDPEEAQAIIDPALQLMMDAVHQYEGYVAQALGDGIFALFGAPLAHEDHPQRALYAALRMQEEMRRYADSLRAKGYPPLLMRVGVNTGEVVLRSIHKDDLHADYVPVGHSTNLAARMEQLAPPGSILVTAYTHRLTDGYFAFKDLGPTQIKGVEGPLNIYEVLGAGPLRTRLQIAARRGLTRFVGRHSEMEQLQRALEQAKAGHGQIVGTMGEPGLGKSRLFYEFKLFSLNGCLVLEAYSVSHGKASAYLPVIELLKSYFRIESQDDERTRREKVGGKVLMLDRSLEDTLPYLFALLSIEEQPSPLQQMDPQIRRRRTFDAIKKLLLRESLNQTLILIFEDLHWIDGETQGFLDALSESVASAKILLLTNYRPEYRHEWGQKTYYTQLRLAPFGKEEAEEFLEVLLGESPRPVGERARVRGIENNLQPLKQLILDKTQGTPFFMEEVVQALVEDGTLTGAPGQYQLTQHGSAQHVLTLHIPTTVQAVLTARIDRLAPNEKALLQQLSVIGREFPLSLVRCVVPQSEDELYRLLASLQHKEFLYEQPAFPESEYIFKHALTQDVAYNSVLIERRKVLHEQTAQAIEQLYHDQLEEHYDDLAHHYQHSGNTAKAIHYLHLAGQQTVQRSAHAEAAVRLTSALELLDTVPETTDRMRTELTLLISLSAALQTTRGFTAPEMEPIYRRSQKLGQQVGDTWQLFSAINGLRRLHYVRGELQTAHTLAEQLLSLARASQDPSLLVMAHQALGAALLTLGELTTAGDHFEKGIALYEPRQHAAQALSYGEDAGILCFGFMSRVLSLLGYQDQAERRCFEAQKLANEVNHPLSIALSLFFACCLHQSRGEVELTEHEVDTLRIFATEQKLVLPASTATSLHGWVLTSQGLTKEGLDKAEQGIAALRRLGARLPFHLALLAEIYQKASAFEKGLATLTEAFSLIAQGGERYYEAELYRLKGELLLMQADKLREGARGYA